MIIYYLSKYNRSKFSPVKVIDRKFASLFVLKQISTIQLLMPFYPFPLSGFQFAAIFLYYSTLFHCLILKP